VIRTPWYCAGCPHNTSTRVVEGSTAMAGIGCHYMVQWMDRSTDTITHMGGEGVPWTALSRYTEEKHRFVNLGDGTFFHSGRARHPAVGRGRGEHHLQAPLQRRRGHDRRAERGRDADARSSSPTCSMGGRADDPLPVETPGAYQTSELAPGTEIRHRDAIDDTMRELREVEGVTAIVFVQTCAAEKRRRRKRGTLEDPDMRLWISPEVCEGCGDCSVQSNCVAVEPAGDGAGAQAAHQPVVLQQGLFLPQGLLPVLRDGAGRPAATACGQGAARHGSAAEPERPPLERTGTSPWRAWAGRAC
jgi:indolepyruvate ferredoxin oxidoreductase